MLKKSFVLITLFIVLSQCSLQRQILEILNEIPESIPRIVQANVETVKNSIRSILFPQLANRPPVSPRAFHRQPIKQLTRKQLQQLQKQESFDFMSLFLNKIEQIHHVVLNHNKTKTEFELKKEQIKKNQSTTTTSTKIKQRQLQTTKTDEGTKEEEKLECLNGAYLVQADKLIFYCNTIEISTDNYEYLKVCNDSTWKRSYYYKSMYIQPDLPTENNYTKCIENYKTLCFPAEHKFTEEITNVSQLAIEFNQQILPTNACYCPKDVYGISCQYINQIFCDWNDKSEYQTCPSYNEFYYVSAYDGEPPCNFMKANDSQSFQFFILFYQQNWLQILNQMFK